MQKIAAIILSLMACLAPALAFFLGRQSVETPEPILQRDTVVFVDTIHVPKPVPYKVIKRDTILVQVKDSVTVHDTLYVELERKSIAYGDSLYKAVVSGVMPSLDYIEIYPRTVHVTETRAVNADPRISIGIQAGYGASKEGLSPYFGIGIQYDIISFLGKDRPLKSSDKHIFAPKRNKRCITKQD